jgi:hypothetical protein
MKKSYYLVVVFVSLLISIGLYLIGHVTGLPNDVLVLVAGLSLAVWAMLTIKSKSGIPKKVGAALVVIVSVFMTILALVGLSQNI